jgi:hypothetical protein
MPGEFFIGDPVGTCPQSVRLDRFGLTYLQVGERAEGPGNVDNSSPLCACIRQPQRVGARERKN